MTNSQNKIYDIEISVTCPQMLRIKRCRREILNLKFIILLLFFGFLIVANGADAFVMESGAYRIQRDSINIGGTEDSNSSAYILKDTVGEIGTGRSPSSYNLYNLYAGYRQYDVVVVEEEEEEVVSGGGVFWDDTALPNITELVVFTTTDLAVIEWKTDVLTTFEIYWGLTEECELGSFSSDVFSKEHQVFIPGLSPDLEYYYKIDLKGKNDRKNFLYPKQFKTLEQPDTVSPANISNFLVERYEDTNDALITWDNPPDPDFWGVRIVRSEKFFPTSIDDGDTIYIGRDAGIINKNLDLDVKYYYTAFSFDVSGNYSSGAVATFAIYKPGEPVLPVIPSIISPELIPPEMEKMLLEYFEFYQNGIRKEFVDGKVNINADESVDIFLDYKNAPEVLKTILITLTEPTDEKKTFSFLLRVNENKTAYTAKIAPLKVSGLYEVSIAVLDYKNQTLKKFKTFLLASAYAAETGITIGEEWNGLFPYIYSGSVLLLLLLLFFLVRYLTRKRNINKNPKD